MRSRRATIIIPTRNRGYCLEKTLPSYLSQPGLGEVIIVDDAGSDDTSSVVENFRKDAAVPVTCIRHPVRQGAPGARNTGLEHASFPLTLFGEDDLILGEDYLPVLMDKMDSLNADIVSGRLAYLNPGESMMEAAERMRSSAGQPHPVDRRLLELVPDARLTEDARVPFTHACILTGTDPARRRGYDLNYPGNGYREETDFQVGVLSQGGRIFMTPDALCFHLSASETALGGQRDMHWLAYEFWTVRNNSYFLDKYYDVLAAYWGNLDPKAVLKLRFMRHRWDAVIRKRIMADLRSLIVSAVPAGVKRLLRRDRLS